MSVQPAIKGDVEAQKYEPQKRIRTILVVQFLMVGLVAMLGWNFVLTEAEFLKIFGDGFPFYMAFFYAAAVNLGQCFLIFYGKKFTFGSRFTAGCVTMAASQVVISVLALSLDAKTAQGAGFWICNVVVFILGAGNALQESTTMGLAALCPAILVTAIMVGEGVAGLLGWPISMLVTAILEGCGLQEGTADETLEKYRNLIFFIVSAVINIALIPMYYYGMGRDETVRSILDDAEKQDTENMSVSTHMTSNARSTHFIIWHSLPRAFDIWVSFTITFLVFPGEVTLWTSSSGYSGFVPLVIYVFQICDTIGRASSSSRLKIYLSPLHVRILAVCRGAFIPLFICMANASSGVLYEDWFKYLIMALFAVTNGTVVTWGMVHGPQQVPQSERDICGYVMAFSIVFGILCGSLLALPLSPSN